MEGILGPSLEAERCFDGSVSPDILEMLEDREDGLDSNFVPDVGLLSGADIGLLGVSCFCMSVFDPSLLIAGERA